MSFVSPIQIELSAPFTGIDFQLEDNCEFPYWVGNILYLNSHLFENPFLRKHTTSRIIPLLGYTMLLVTKHSKLRKLLVRIWRQLMRDLSAIRFLRPHNAHKEFPFRLVKPSFGIYKVCSGMSDKYWMPLLYQQSFLTPTKLFLDSNRSVSQVNNARTVDTSFYVFISSSCQFTIQYYKYSYWSRCNQVDSVLAY